MECNLAETRRFLWLLYPGEETHCFQTFKNLDSYPNQPHHGFRPADDKCLLNLVRENKLGAGVYFVVQKTDGAGRKTENITSVRALFVDLDGAPLQPVLDAKVRPHIITQTSEDRYQAFWKVKDFPLEKCVPYLKALAEKFGGDTNICDLPRVMRLPGYYNMKREPPYLVSIYQHYAGAVYTPDDMLHGLQLLPKPTGQKKEEIPVADDEPIPDGVRNRTLVTIAARLRNAGLSGERLFEALEKENQARCSPPKSRAEVLRVAQWAAKKPPGHVPPARSDVTKEPPRLTCCSWEDLMKTEFPKKQWIIEDILPVGLGILIGKSRIRKSFMAQALAYDVSIGAPVFDHYESHATGVLCLCLEDSMERIQERLMIISSSRPSKTVEFTNTLDPRSPAIEQLTAYLTDHPDIRLVIVDPWAKFKDRDFGRGNPYDTEYQALSGLHALAHNLKIALLLVHHQGKKKEVDDIADAAIGTTAIAGAADTHWWLQRDPKDNDLGTLIMAGRDIEDIKVALRFDRERLRWTYEGKTWEKEEALTSEVVLAYLEEMDSPVGVLDIAKATGRKEHTIRKIISRLSYKGLVERMTKGRYQILKAPEQSGYDMGRV